MMARHLACRTLAQEDKPRDRKLRNVIIAGNAIAWAVIFIIFRALP